MTLAQAKPAERPRVVIVGAGFGGLATAKGLAGVPVDVVVIDKTNHNLFQPLLYQVATAALAPSDIAVPVRSIFSDRPEVTVLMDEATGIDTNRRVVRLAEAGEIGFDMLVLATGSVYSWFGHDEWAEHAYVLKTLEDALMLRGSLLAAFEWAESRTDPSEIERLLTFVVVGGGPTGVELAGAIAELAHSSLSRDFRHIRSSSARIVLCEGGPHLLAGFPQHLSDYARKHLEDLHVEVLTNTAVQSVDHDGVVAGGTRINSANVLWCAGTAATPAAVWLQADKSRNGAVKIAPDCTVPGHIDIFAVGDVTDMTGPNGKPLPGVGPVAKQQGAYVAEVIAARVAGRPAPARFVYKDAGSMAMVGRSSAVADLGKVRLTGFVAWVLWSAVHLFFLIGTRNRIAVYLNWAWAWLTYGRGARLITRLDPRTRLELKQQNDAGSRPV
ncbi:NAD(P)/FAD-dependent oxidoreductase [Lichenihabitans sp. PAMC28606]|uniref:NAD(P)/FAD-dependent oxidoreductase n=1 Tax=Lichenihabitans sp. PAMC28606 TaxID=2880932 RepID=UPI001D0AB9A0|nr:NAD(P)/FAD-dependent oxidoreductase [Lichenihabitans sp. PAMC28606]UDL96316.1 NAD(P)/FAD-dependent oxidoreductase [Lichenihabitans sp. PAMC28606]